MEQTAGMPKLSITEETKDQQQQLVRQLAHPQLAIWGDRFLNYNPPPSDTQLCMEEELDKLKKEVRKNLLAAVDDPKERVVYLDAIERLGVAYHFEEEIEPILQQFSDNYNEQNDVYDNDLYYISLRFRILRQHGFVVSCDVFEKFKGEEGNFIESITKDVQGMLSLYEASNLRVHGEKILDEAMNFTKTQLKSLIGELTEPLATHVSRALKMPLHKGLPRLLSRYYIDTYEAIPSHDKDLLRFAKIDFNLLQSLHLKELRDLSRWWRSHGITTKLPFVRDRIVETYMFASGLYEPQYALVRSMCTKLCIMAFTTTDDIYDEYGSFEELVLYTEAIQRWDRSCTNQLPDCMKWAYEKLFDTFDEFEQELAKDGRSHVIFYFQEMMKELCRAYIQDAKWEQEKRLPTYEDYMEHDAITTGVHTLLSAAAFVGLGKIATEEAFKWIAQNPKPARAGGIIGRLLNDVAGYKKEFHVVSAVECLIQQYGTSEERAIEEIYEKVEEAWKDLNEELLRPTKFPRALLTAILNLARGSEFLYRFGNDEYSIVNQAMYDKICALLIDPMVV